MNVGSKIRQLRKARGMTISDLSRLTGQNVGNISRLERGQQGYSDQSLKKIANALGVPLSEFFSDSQHGQVNVELQTKNAESKIYRLDLLDVSDHPNSENLSKDMIEIITSIEFEPEEAKPLFGKRPADQVKIFNIRGDGMQGTIDPGDLVYVDTGVSQFEGEGIYIFIFKDDLWVKRLQKIKGELYVLSDNPLYREWVIAPSEFPDLSIRGKVLFSQPLSLKRHS